MDRSIYARARAAGIPASSAAAIARQVRKDWPLSWTEDGFDIRASDSPEEYWTLEDGGYGRFLTGSEDWRTGYERKPHPDAIPNPYRDSRNVSGGDHWYVPGAAGTLRERYAEYRRDTYGMSRAVAWDAARESVEDELRHVTDDYGPDVRVVNVKVSRNGITLGRASVGGVEIAWDPITRRSGEDYLAECARDIAPEAIAEAREALAGLLEGIA